MILALGPLGINDGANYEFYAGETPAGAAIWSKSFNETVSYFSWWNNSGITAMTYLLRSTCIANTVPLIFIKLRILIGSLVRINVDQSRYFPKMKKLIAVTETTCLGCGVRVDFDFDTYVLEADSPDGTIPGAVNSQAIYHCL